MGKYIALFTGTSFLMFFALPMFSGVTSIPQNLNAVEIGKFIGSILGYWTDVLIMALKNFL